MTVYTEEFKQKLMSLGEEILEQHMIAARMTDPKITEDQCMQNIFEQLQMVKEIITQIRAEQLAKENESLADKCEDVVDQILFGK